MLIVFANNQAMAADAGTSSVITTDPVPLRGNDRATIILLAHYFFGGGAAPNRSFAVQPQVSNDGVTFVNAGTITTIGAASDTPVKTESTVVGAYLRYQFTLTAQSGTTVAHICFDLPVNIDHV